MKNSKYAIKKSKTDLISSLQSIDKKVLDKSLSELGLSNIEKLKEYVIDSFSSNLDFAKDDKLTQNYFINLLENEDTTYLPYPDDISSFFVFIYKKNNEYYYYIPDEIKKIILKKIKIKPNLDNKNINNNYENAIHTPIIKDLQFLLSSLTVGDLKHIGQLFFVNGLSNRKKKDLVNIIYSVLTNENKLKEVTFRFNKKEFDLLKRLINNNGTIQDNNISEDAYYYLYLLGIVFIFTVDDKFYVSMTDDVYNIYRKINLKDFNKKILINDRIYNLVRAMVELYGIVSIEDIYYSYNKYYGEEGEDDISFYSIYFCERCDYITYFDICNKRYFANKVFDKDEFENILYDIIDRQNSIKRKEISLFELLKYTDYDYYEKIKEHEKLRKYLKNKNIPNCDIEDIIYNIAKLCRLGNGFLSVLLEMLTDYNVKLDSENIDEITEYLVLIYNNSRIWANNGWTPLEMQKYFK